MAQKLENFAYPVGKKIEKSDDDFYNDLDILYMERDAYISLKNEYLEKRGILGQAEQIIKNSGWNGGFGTQNLKEAKKEVRSLKKELKYLDIQIKYLAKKMEKVIKDPRYSELIFDEGHDNGMKFLEN